MEINITLATRQIWQESLDLELLLNLSTQPTRVRLLAAPVAPETANLRRMKAKRKGIGL